MPEYRVYEFRTSNGGNGPDWKNKIVDYLPIIAIILFALLLFPSVSNLFSNSVKLFVTYPIFILSLILHELSHAYMADFLGDPTPRLTGRLTLNPLKHLDLWGTLLFIFCGFGWAKPVQVDASNFRKPDRAMVSVALAGPLCNLFLALLGALIFKITLESTDNINYLFYIGFICYQTTYINAILAVFNLIPIPPLDGSRLVHYLLPQKYKDAYYQYARQYAFVIMILVFLYAGNMIAPIVKDILINLGYGKFNLIVYQFFNSVH